MNTVPRIVLALVLTGLAGVLNVVHAGGTAEKATPRGYEGTVVYLEGDVQVNGAPAELGQKISGSFSVNTGPESVCEITFGGKNIVRINPDTVTVVNLAQQVPEINLKTGGVASVLRKLDKIAGSDSFRIRTGNAVAGVRGTVFFVQADANQTYVCACNGSVRTIDASGSNEHTIVASHHQAKVYRSSGSSTAVEDAGMLWHDDATMEALAARIGEKIDWTRIDE